MLTQPRADLTTGLRVRDVDSVSTLARAGLKPRDVVLAVDGIVPRDLIDLQFDLPSASSLLVERGGRRVQLELEPGSSTADLALADPVPDGIRECNNHCEFCFIRGLPQGLRSTLYVFDDDYRYSFLWGNFLTLTNLDQRDWERIGYQRLSPLNVSVHATDPAVRRRMLNNRHAPEILPQLDRLGRLGIRVNTQIVLSAGTNDGPELERSLRDLSERWPTVQSVSVVPVGLTRFSRVRNIRRPAPREAQSAVDLAESIQAEMRRRVGTGVVYPSDELYLLAGRGIPPASAYDGFPVLTNGVGMLRSMLDEWDRLLRRRHRVPAPRQAVWLTARLARPALEAMADRWHDFAGWRPDVRLVENGFFGEQVTVSGLLTGADLLAAVRAIPPNVDDVVLPRTAFGFDGRATLDGVTADEIGAAHPGRVHLASTPAELLEALTV